MKDILGFPLFVCLDLTYRCNLGCSHCFFIDDFNETDYKELSTDEVKKLLDQLDKENVFYFQFSGGEPFCRDDIIELIRYTKNKKFLTSITTNGLFIDKSIAKEIKDSNIRTVQISLDGSTRELHEKIRGTATFDKTIDAIKLLQNEGVNVTLAYTLNRYNFNDIENSISLNVNLGIKSLRFQILVRFGNANKNFDILSLTKDEVRQCFENISNNCYVKNKKINTVLPCTMQFLNDNKIENLLSSAGCGAGTTSVNINPYGVVTACAVLTDDYWSVGNIRDQSLKDIWMSDLLDKWRNFDSIDGKCRHCDILDLCRGGCRANALMYNKNFFAEDPLCWRKSYAV